VFGKGEWEKKEGRRSGQEKDGDRQLRKEERKNGRHARKAKRREASKDE